MPNRSPPSRRRGARATIAPATRARSPGLPYNVRVADVLSRPALLIGTEASLFDAVVLMRTHGITGMPVIDATGTVVGVVSQKDLARLVAGSSAFPEISGVLDVLLAALGDQPTLSMRHWRSQLERTRVREVMSTPAFVIHPSAPLELAAEVMRDHAINRLPVVEDGRLVGIVTRHDLARALVPASTAR
jgi:CBS domain-containing protein